MRGNRRNLRLVVWMEDALRCCARQLALVVLFQRFQQRACLAADATPVYTSLAAWFVGCTVGCTGVVICPPTSPRSATVAHEDRKLMPGQQMGFSLRLDCWNQLNDSGLASVKIAPGIKHARLVYLPMFVWSTARLKTGERQAAVFRRLLESKRFRG